MTNRERQAQATKQKLLDSAKRLISERGFDHVKVSDIAADCGMVKGSFYHYFRSKDEIVAALRESVYDNLRRDVYEEAGLGFQGRIQLFVQNWYKALKDLNLHIARYSMQQYANNIHINPHSSDLSHMEQGMSLLTDCIREGVQRGELLPETPVEVLAKGIMFALQGSALFHCKQEEQFDVEQWCEEFQSFILAPLLAAYLTDSGTEK
ncbi:MAG: TetR/AcrR family transcriptional regulator [Faecousia sp.]